MGVVLRLCLSQLSKHVCHLLMVAASVCVSARHSFITPLPLPTPDVPCWLKSLRLHKYQHLFADLGYKEMLTMQEEYLEQKVQCFSFTVIINSPLAVYMLSLSLCVSLTVPAFVGAGERVDLKP